MMMDSKMATDILALLFNAMIAENNTVVQKIESKKGGMIFWDCHVTPLGLSH